MADKPDPDSAFVETEAPKTAKDGVAMNGRYPVNHRLRAEALAAADKAEDPDGIVSKEAISGAGKRLARKAKAEAKAAPKDATPAPATPSSK